MEERVEVAVVEVGAESACVLGTLDQQQSSCESPVDLAAEQLGGRAGVKDHLTERQVGGLLLEDVQHVVPEGLPGLRECLFSGQLGAVCVASHLLFEHGLHQGINGGGSTIDRTDADARDTGETIAFSIGP